MRRNPHNSLGISVAMALAFILLICAICIALAWQYSGMILLGMPVQLAIFTILLPGALCFLVYRFCMQLDLLPAYDQSRDKEV